MTLLEFIRIQPCIICGKIDSINPNGDTRVTVSHVKTKGSGGEDEDNVLPMCIFCHRRFEDSTKGERQSWLPMAKEYTKKWRNEFLK